MFEIKKRDIYGGSVIYRSETTDNLRDAVKDYNKSLNGQQVDLTGADLSGADLHNAHLSNANFSGADLSGADLSGAHLEDADLTGADLSGADLRCTDLTGAKFRGVDLREANFTGAHLISVDFRGAILAGADLQYTKLHGADLRGANLTGAKLLGASFGKGKKGIGLRPENLGLPSADPLLEKRVIEMALLEGALEMGTWHTCDTTHCLAGWAVHLSGPIGYELESVTSSSCAGALLVPNLAHLFYDNNETVKLALQERLAEITKSEVG